MKKVLGLHLSAPQGQNHSLASWALVWDKEEFPKPLGGKFDYILKGNFIHDRTKKNPLVFFVYEAKNEDDFYYYQKILSQKYDNIIGANSYDLKYLLYTNERFDKNDSEHIDELTKRARKACEWLVDERNK